MPLTPSERKLRSSIAGSTGWANTVDRAGRARHASRGIWERFYRETDATLPEHVRAAQADSAYKAHMKRLAFRSAKARRERKEAAERQARARREARAAEALDGGAA